jgi:hypothetical protein
MRTKTTTIDRVSPAPTFKPVSAVEKALTLSRARAALAKSVPTVTPRAELPLTQRAKMAVLEAKSCIAAQEAIARLPAYIRARIKTERAVAAAKARKAAR